MPIELPTYRYNIMRLNSKFPDKDKFSYEDVSHFAGLCVRTIKEQFVFKNHCIEKLEFARQLAWTGKDNAILSITERYNGRMPTPFNLYEDNLKRLDGFFPDAEILNISDLTRFTGRNKRVVREIFPFEGSYICKVNFANMLARLGLKQK